jgi:hypothetical protein
MVVDLRGESTVVEGGRKEGRAEGERERGKGRERGGVSHPFALWKKRGRRKREMRGKGWGWW